MERHCETDYTSKWNSVVPNILELASAGEGEGVGLRQYLDLYSHDNISDGKLKLFYYFIYTLL